ncbi:hypothetical protein CALCODRAFT_492681 [Calocera cornea HHB12733]|uniref:Uncharacterized protein n=1 Tax=Calocera cornea HHB12733 TaxID=1353952 RepID=A0A165IAQ3_9BASI|nr:hypothetical protein CALCODRAFT_492681 [Calocera cornea HHB12733]
MPLPIADNSDNSSTSTIRLHTAYSISSDTDERVSEHPETDSNDSHSTSPVLNSSKSPTPAMGPPAEELDEGPLFTAESDLSDSTQTQERFHHARKPRPRPVSVARNAVARHPADYEIITLKDITYNGRRIVKVSHSFQLSGETPPALTFAERVRETLLTNWVLAIVMSTAGAVASCLIAKLF